MIVNIGEQKLKVYWNHHRPETLVFLDGSTKPFYGSTKCLIEEWKTYDTFAEGKAECSSKDNFNKSKGRIVSLTKAIKHLPKDVRKQFFQQYAKEIGW